MIALEDIKTGATFKAKLATEIATVLVVTKDFVIYTLSSALDPNAEYALRVTQFRNDFEAIA